jgi:tetratricopeptide (TPR) repeat protein
LAKKTEARYQSADELSSDLKAVDTQAPDFIAVIRRAMDVVPATVARMFKRQRVSIGYVAVGIVVLALLAWGAWRWTRSTPHQPPPEAQRSYDRAVEAMREGAFFRASKLFQQAIDVDDQFALAYAGRAECLTELDSSDQAKSELIEAQDLIPDSSILPTADGLRFQAVTNTVKGNFTKAIESYQSIVAMASSSEKAYAFVDLGRAYEKNEEIEKAIEAYSQGKDLNPHYAAAFLRLGILQGRNAQYPEAYASFDRAYDLFDLDIE